MGTDPSGPPVRSTRARSCESRAVSLAKTDVDSRSLVTHALCLDPQIWNWVWGRDAMGPYSPFSPWPHRARFSRNLPPLLSTSQWVMRKIITTVITSSPSLIEWAYSCLYWMKLSGCWKRCKLLLVTQCGFIRFKATWTQKYWSDKKSKTTIINGSKN